MAAIAAAAAPALVWDRIDENQRKTRRLLTLFALLMIPFGMALVPIATYVVSVIAPLVFERQSAMFWLLLDADAVFVMLVIAGAAAVWQYRTAGRALFRRAGATPIEDRESRLRRTVENLCIGAGLPAPDIYVVETASPNAFATGLDPQRAQVAVTRGLLELLDDRELAGVIAHELSHVGNGDVRMGSVLAACVTVLRLPLAVVAQFGVVVAALCVAASMIALLFAVDTFAKIAVTLTYLARYDDLLLQLREGMIAEVSVMFFSMVATAAPAFLLWGGHVLGWSAGRSVLQERELLADADAFALTHDSEGLACALAKVEAVGCTTPGADGSNAHLYVVDPMRNRTPWWNRPIMAHPPVDQRITALQSLAAFPDESLERARATARQWAADHPAARTVTPASGDDSSGPIEGPLGLASLLGWVVRQAVRIVFEFLRAAGDPR